MTIIISAEGLGKKYFINHEPLERYTTLRDVLATRTKRVARTLTRPFSASEKDEAATREDFWALRDVSFEIREGDRVGIIGRNGAGKSTLLKIMSRITEPSVGRVRITGRVASLLEVGTGFHPELTGRENVFLNGAILGMTKAEIKRKFDEIVTFSEMEKFLDTPVKRYSSGMAVRLAFAVAAHLEPEILIVDEVLAVGDINFQKKCLGKMKEVAGQGRTVLFVSHNMAAIENLCDTGILLNRGQIAFTGDVQAVIARYAAENSSASGGSVDLAERKERRYGPKEYARFTALRLVDLHERSVEFVQMGQPVKFLLDVDISRPRDDFEVGVRITNLYGVPVHELVSNWEGFQSISKSGPTTVEAAVPAVYLFPGDYLVDIWIKRQGEGFYSDDIVLEALRFTVEEAQITPYLAQFKRYSHNTQVYQPSSWRIVT